MERRYTIDGRGVVAPVDQGSAQDLAARQGNWSTLVTGPDWMVWLRRPPAGGTRDKPKAVLAGDCASFALADFMAYLGQSRFSGGLRISAGNAERTLWIKDGEVRSASSDSPQDRVGEVMVRLGYVTRQVLESVLAENPPSRVGKVLVERNILKAHDLFKCITEQVGEIFHAMMLVKEGAFVLIDQDPDAHSSNPLSLTMNSLLMDSIRKIDEMGHFRKKIPHARMYVMPKKAGDSSLEQEEAQLLTLVDGRHTIQEIGQRLRHNEFDATRIVFRLLEGGYVTIAQQAQAAQTQAKPSGPAEQLNQMLAVFDRIFREVYSEVSSHGLGEPFLIAANASLQTGGVSQSVALKGMTFNHEGGLPIDALRSRVAQVANQLGPEPILAVRQALSDVMFFLLFQAGELLEARADEALAQRVKQLLASLDQK